MGKGYSIDLRKKIVESYERRFNTQRKDLKYQKDLYLVY